MLIMSALGEDHKKILTVPPKEQIKEKFQHQCKKNTYTPAENIFTEWIRIAISQNRDNAIFLFNSITISIRFSFFLVWYFVSGRENKKKIVNERAVHFHRSISSSKCL